MCVLPLVSLHVCLLAILEAPPSASSPPPPPHQQTEVWVDVQSPLEGALGVEEGVESVKPHPLDPHNTETHPEECTETGQG